MTGNDLLFELGHFQQESNTSGTSISRPVGRLNDLKEMVMVKPVHAYIGQIIDSTSMESMSMI